MQEMRHKLQDELSVIILALQIGKPTLATAAAQRALKLLRLAKLQCEGCKLREELGLPPARHV